jgi:hypothetical protein
VVVTFMPPTAVWITSCTSPDGQAVARRRVAVDVEVEVVAAERALGIDAERARDR